MKSIPKTPETPGQNDASGSGGRPIRLSWTDPEEGQTLWIELWGSPEFVEDLVTQGFEVRPVEEDETASSLCVRIQHRPAPAA